MVGEDYFEVMKETSREADNLIEPCLGTVVEVARALPKSRLGKPRLRGMLVKLGYEIAGGNDWRKVAPLCASYELLNCSSYVINWIFDEKGGDKEKRDKDNLIIGGFQLRETAEKILRERGLEDVVESLSRINRAIYRGQDLDLNVLTLDNLSQFSSYGDFMAYYQRRCHWLSGEFYGQCLLNGSRISGNENQNLYDVGEILGSGLQVSNDLGDFALAERSVEVCEKPYKDQLSDLRQGKLTLPVYLLATRTGICESGLKGLPPDEAIKLLHSTGTFQTCLDYLKHQRKRAKKALYEVFEKSDVRDLLATTLVIIHSNKFITNIKNARRK